MLQILDESLHGLHSVLLAWTLDLTTQSVHHACGSVNRKNHFDVVVKVCSSPAFAIVEFDYCYQCISVWMSPPDGKRLRLVLPRVLHTRVSQERA